MKSCIFGQYVLVLISLVSLFESREPDYENIVYGGVWKQITLNPSKEYTQVALVELKLEAYLGGLKLWLNHSIDEIICHTMATLLYSRTEREPQSFTKELKTKEGLTYPVSIPIPLGYTFHCLIKTKNKEKTFYNHHHITATTSLDQVEEIFISSHVFYSLNQKLKDDKNINLIYSSTQDVCENQRFNSDIKLNILSTFAQTREFTSLFCENKFKSVFKKHSCNAIVKTTDNVNSMNSSLNLQLKVMTYNIWNFNPYSNSKLYSKRINKLLKLIDSRQPDILGLQEVRLESTKGGRLGPNQINQIASQLYQYQYVFQPGQLFDSTLSHGRCEEGVAILSKYPILYHDYLLLFRNKSNSADSHQRVCLHVVIYVPGIGNAHIFNTHYSLSHEAREAASKQILEFMSLYEGPAILMGDLNATPEEKCIRMLVENTDLIDVWRHVHKEDPGYTFNTLETKLSKRIDYIMMRKSPRVQVKSVTVLDDNAQKNVASDHRAVQAVLSFKTCS